MLRGKLERCMSSPALDLDRDGAVLFPRLACSQMEALGQLLSRHLGSIAGTRLFGDQGLREMLDGGPIARLASALIGSAARPVRAILFDKSETSNWSLGWHQDRVIALRRRVDSPGFGPWTVKRGVPHVAPPVELLAAMITLRIHLDPVPDDNAPLLVAPGSHRLGLIAEPAIPAVVARCGVRACLAAPGDVWANSTLILHASQRSVGHAHRRLLQLDYAAFDLPPALEWRGI